MKSSFCIDLQRFMLTPTKFPLTHLNTIHQLCKNINLTKRLLNSHIIILYGQRAILLYQTPDGNSQTEVKLQNNTVWLSLDQMAELFQRNKSTISRHIKNVLEDGELAEEATVANFATVQNEGTRTVERTITFYNLDMIISVGYRVHSYRGKISLLTQAKYQPSLPKRKPTTNTTNSRNVLRTTFHPQRFTSWRTLNGSRRD